MICKSALIVVLYFSQSYWPGVIIMEQVQRNAEGPRGAELLKGMRLRRGLNDDLRQQIIVKSRYAHIQASTPKDLWDPRRGYGRFANQQSLEHWLKTHDDIFALTEQSSLVGVAWFRPETLPDRGQRPVTGRGSNVTFATRLYEHRGKGLASRFYDASIKVYVDELRGRGELDSLTGISLETDEANIAARKSYERTGWVYTHTGYEARVDNPDGTFEMRPRVLMELLPEAIHAAYFRAESLLRGE
jgi:ribosomal protein S18 acetylase RimI-like enzyme